MIGTGAANVATYRLLASSGVDVRRIVACDTKGTLHPNRRDIADRREEFRDKWRICTETNADGVVGGIAEALRGADVCIAFSASGPNIIRPEWVKRWPATRSSSPAPTPLPKSGPGRPPRREPGLSPPDGATFPTS